MDLVRSDGVKVMFKETENMEIKDNKLNINIPEGMEIDILNSNFGTGVICFKKKQPEFKDGDVVFVRCKRFCYIEIFNYFKDDGLYDYASLCTTQKMIDICGKYPIFKDDIVEIRLATDSEKKQLFEALAKKGKAWDSEKKAIVDLKPKVELKPFDKVLSRRCYKDYWVLNFYSHKTDYYHICIDGSSNLYCIPYNEETAHLLGTTDEWKGGEG